MQDAISMSADGWRPIIGTRRQPPGFPTEIKPQEITEYKNPSETVNVDIVKAETIEPSSTNAPQKLSTSIKPPDSTSNNINGGGAYMQGEKIPPHSKFTSPGPYHTLPASVHGPPIPISGSLNKPVKFGQIKKRPANKPSTPSYFGPKRKPIRGQMVAHSTRNEVFVRPPASFPFIKQGQTNIKTRETQGLGLLGSNHFVVNQPSYIEFANRFALPPTEDNFQVKNHPITYIFSKPGNDQYQFTSQNDEYTRNLVPPPPLAIFQQDANKLKPIKVNTNINNENVIASTEPIIKLSDFGSNIQFGRKPVEIQENLVPQLPPPFEQNFAFQKQFNKPKEQTVDVQVTKEKFKVFHSNQPVNYNTNAPDYIDYDFHSLKKPVQYPKLQTYEVTEGKWVDNPNPFTFTITKSQPIVAQPLRQLSTAVPQLVTEPIVELNVPPFLPTPYKPQGAVPTSPTQGEVSTIFSQVSTKMNRYKNEALTTNPFFFDVKEVSTHYPILGKPELKPESPTNNPLPMDSNGEISNEITTMTPMTKPPQQNKSRRRRPRPRRPSTTTTTTTTEEPVPTENYNLQKIEELFEGVSIETEKPQIRRRPRPNRYRTNNIEDRPTRYRTTTPPSETEESNEKQIRTRNRSRNRGNIATSENRNTFTRKRIRPTTTDMPPNHKVMEYDASLQSTESSEPYIEQVQSVERETQGLFETKYPQENAQSSDTKPNRVEYESPNRHLEPVQYEDESKYETTIVSNDLSSIRKPNYEETEEEETERMQIYERTRPSISDSTEQDTTANIHLPENEIDYSTSVPIMELIEERIQTTIATTMPTTTPEATTTKSHRIRGRPIKSRPRFSVKDYRQRLNQYTSTTPSTTTDFVKTTSEGGLRLRFPSRLRSRPPSKTTTTTTESYDPDEEEQTEPIRRGSFKPKEPRHGTTTESTQNNIITEKYVKSVNTRLRPFGRYRSTTEPSSVSQKVSIKPNLFSVRRRPPQLSLRNRIQNKNNTNTIEDPTTIETETENTESVTAPTTEPEFENVSTESSTVKIKMEPTTEIVETTTANLNEDDYIQRVSDLTSSFKNEYETPGLFKSVSPNSRRIPSYFTISTDDPILPIEAFFPNLKDKEQE
ncbi:proteoglycan 4-like [Anoplophora glabripennis]|uniref:proteoglycan 4-like n=1 Tax=Anoplophora glabripennis TaxID=217634 RepID=UPI000875A583|nr:proteoglycan 4-like [Anoplophora glabripennis]